jgi:hypothetical protein
MMVESAYGPNRLIVLINSGFLSATPSGYNDPNRVDAGHCFHQAYIRPEKHVFLQIEAITEQSH